MVALTSYIESIIFGEITRDFILPVQGFSHDDIPGGSVLYAYTGWKIWNNNPSRIGLISKTGKDIPNDWFNYFQQKEIECLGFIPYEGHSESRRFFSYGSKGRQGTDSIVEEYSRRSTPLPKSILGYDRSIPRLDSRNTPSPITIFPRDIPNDFLDATTALLCPLDFLTHALVPTYLKTRNLHSILLNPPAGYMDPIFWVNIPYIIQGTAAIITSEKNITNLFRGRSVDLWDMMGTLASFGCETVVVRRDDSSTFLFIPAIQSKYVIPPYPSRVQDPTGGEDAFCGGFLAGYRKTYDPLESCLYGAVSCSLVIEGSGFDYALTGLQGLPIARLGSLREKPYKL